MKKTLTSFLRPLPDRPNGLLSLLVLLLACFNGYSQEQHSPEIEARIKQVEQGLSGRFLVAGQPKHTIKERMAFYHINGLSIAVIHDYHIEWAKGYGWADSAGQQPVSTQTLFQAASISKSLNAVGVLKLAQDGKLNLYRDINDYLTSWKFPYDSLSKGKKITIANLLSHTGGLSVHGFPGYAMGDTLPTLEQVLDGRRPANTGPVRSMYEPGVKSEYSGGGTTISQLIVMDVTHEPYDKYMRDNVLKPLGMTSSFYTQPAPADKRQLLATGYRSNGAAIEGKYHIYPEEAPAGLWTNPTDLCQYIIETQNAYAGRSAKVLTQENTKLRLTPYIDSTAALGVFINKIGTVTYFQHGGANEGFRSQYYASLEGGNGVVVMVNSDNGSILQEVVNSVATAYTWKGFYEPEVKTAFSLQPAQLKAYEGRFKYRGARQLYVTITAKDDRLGFLQEWDGQKVDFLPGSTIAFFSPDAGIEIKFIKADDGSVNALSVFDRDFFDKVDQ
jgi:CubicO group peptidase (beta-lactamase class C family)